MFPQGIRNVKGQVIYSAQDPDDPQHQQHLKLGGRPLSVNFGIWWDGDLLRELLDHETVSKYDWLNHTIVDVVKFSGVVFNNGTKSNPSLSAAAQNVGYNQPSEPGFYLGAEMFK